MSDSNAVASAPARVRDLGAFRAQPLLLVVNYSGKSFLVTAAGGSHDGAPLTDIGAWAVERLAALPGPRRAFILKGISSPSGFLRKIRRTLKACPDGSRVAFVGDWTGTLAGCAITDFIKLEDGPLDAADLLDGWPS